mgnify:CR=1 FL=1
MATSNQILEKYLSTLEKDPSSRVFAPLAEYYRKNGLLTQAIDTLSEGIKHNPEYVLGHLGLAFCHHDNGATKRAYDILRPLVDSNRDNIRMLKLFSDICLDLKKNQEALQYLKFLLFINPKDQETAEKVKELESNNSDFGPIKFNIEDDLSESGEQIQFNVDAISSTPEASSDMDEWIQVDFKSPEEKTLSTDGWSMEKDISLDQVENQDSENERDFKIDIVETSKEKPKQVDSPVITHTLVDLYCNQGYLDKAKDLLEKILDLNPNDIKTKLKLQEVNRVLSESYLDDLDDATEEVSVSEESNEILSEDDGRSELMNLFDKKILDSNSTVDVQKETKPSPLERKLWLFHKALEERSKEILQS